MLANLPFANVWLRPATPNKMTTKRKDNRTRLGRIIQGEKGIGRFAIHKLGTKIESTIKLFKIFCRPIFS